MPQHAAPLAAGLSITRYSLPQSPIQLLNFQLPDLSIPRLTAGGGPVVLESSIVRISGLPVNMTALISRWTRSPCTARASRTVRTTESQQGPVDVSRPGTVAPASPRHPVLRCRALLSAMNGPLRDHSPCDRSVWWARGQPTTTRSKAARDHGRRWDGLLKHGEREVSLFAGV